MWPLLLLLASGSRAISPVQNNEVRETQSLDGLWTFVREPRNGGDIGIGQQWNKLELGSFQNATVMPVPSAYNDLGDADLRDHVGWVWYERSEIVAQRHEDQRVFIRIDSANYYSIVYVNSVEVGRHVGGHMPYEIDVTQKISFGAANKLTVAVNNTLSWQTIPNGDFNYLVQKDNISGVEVDRYPRGYFTMKGNFDFFSYAGLLRPVRMLFKPQHYVDDYWIQAHANGSFRYSFSLAGVGAYSTFTVQVRDADGTVIYSNDGLTGTTVFEQPKLWWPRGLGDPYLYEITGQMLDGSGAVLDVVRSNFGFRTVTFDADRVYWNGKHFYCQGMGMHEEADIRGRAFDHVLMVKDLQNLEWTNANCYRTSHYPYAEERMAEGDRRGIAVIVETPAVGLKSFGSANIDLHKKMVTEMIMRDRNHPSVFMWSMANEPQTYREESRAYFQAVINQARALNTPGIPITTVYGPSQSYNDYTADLLDVVCVNRYYGWYIDMGVLEQIEHSLYNDFVTWKQTFGKPLLITEYGAESIQGMHKNPSFCFTEDYQTDVYNRTHNALERLIGENMLAGELVWVYADFMTAMDTTRVVGNHKGMFTRQREPKKAAFTIRERYGKRFDQTGGI